MIATSGIDNTIKIFSPDQNAQDDARNGINILDPDNPSNQFGRTGSSIGGLESRKRVHESYRIMSQNDVERRGGMNEAHITVHYLPSNFIQISFADLYMKRSMLERLAGNFRGQHGIGDIAITGDHPTIVIDDNCSVCLDFLLNFGK